MILAIIINIFQSNFKNPEEITGDKLALQEAKTSPDEEDAHLRENIIGGPKDSAR